MKFPKIKIPTEELMELIGALLAAGQDRDAIPALVGGFMDETLAFAKLVPGPVGVALEAIDGPVITAAVKLVLSIVPEKKLIAAHEARLAASVGA